MPPPKSNAIIIICRVVPDQEGSVNVFQHQTPGGRGVGSVLPTKQMAKYTALICDDNMAIHSSLTCYLEPEGIDVVSAYDGETALEILRRQPINIMILDVMLPGLDGYELCHEIRKFSDVYIIMLSAKGEDIDRIIGLESGADDYVAKPFSPHEIVIRVKKALKRLYPRQGPKVLTLAELSVYPESYQVFIGEKEISMTSKEVDVLALMLSNIGIVLTRERILNAAWGYEYLGDMRVVDSLIKRLRQKLNCDGVHFAIRSVYGIGYRLVEEKP